MRAVVCKELGDPEGLTVEQVPTVPCGPGEVRVRIWACGVNYVDALFVQGRYQIKPAVPFTPGSEISGELTEIGAEVDGWSIGDRVISSIGLGGFADEIVIDPARLLPLPDRLTFGQGATMFQSYATAWFTLTRRTSVAAGDWVGTLGAAGGVGLAMIDVARSLGASTLAAVSSAERARLCIERGAHSVVDYSAEDLKTRVRELTDGGADVMIDPVGGPLADAALRSLGENGRLMVVGFASGTIPDLPANQILLRNRQVIGVDWGAWALANVDENDALMAEVMEAIERGVLNPIEPDEYPLADAGQALRDLLERRVTGKVCLRA